MNYLLMYALSPIGTLLNACALTFVLLLWGADPARPMFWVIILIFVASSRMLDLRAYLARRRRGFTAYQASQAVTDAIWRPPRQAKTEDEEEAA